MKESGIAFTLGLLAGVAVFAQHIDGSHTEVSAERRLKDYLAATILPPENRLLDGSDSALGQVPTVPGDASAAAEIIGFAGENLLHGSLQISFRVRVREAGGYSFRTYLSDDAQKPFLQSLVTRNLTAGEHKLSFRFYGKAIRISGVKGNYRLTGIVGEKLPAEKGSSGKLALCSQSYRTRSYAITDFTDKDWDSPEKRRKIRELKDEIAKERRLLSK